VDMEYIVFFNYEDGTREFGYYQDSKEAEERYQEATSLAKKNKSRVEIGIAQITDVTKTYIADLEGVE
jgi:hypothetical protein